MPDMSVGSKLSMASGCSWGDSADPAKIKYLLAWPKPKSANELRTYLRFCEYYKKYVPDNAMLVKSLYDLTTVKKSDFV